MGRTVDRETAAANCFEHRVTDFLDQQFADLGLSIERHIVHPASESSPARQNILARLGTNDSRPTLMLEVHQDTVPITGMTINPFAGEMREGRIYGRGACDVKGAMACILATVARLVEAPPDNLPNIVVACTVNEEHGFTGAKHLPKSWGKPPDAIIVSEPTELNVVVAHKGVVRWKCTATGRAVHSSNPAIGDNAIYRMAAVIRHLQTYAAEVVPNLGEHPRLGRPSLSVGTIAGGISVNTVPDKCVIEIDRRILPDEDPAAAQAHVMEYLQSQLGDDANRIHHGEPFITARGLKDEYNGPLAAQLIAAAQQSGVSSKTIGVPFGTDASAFGSEVPTVVFGPGSIAQAHTDDEWIAVDQLHQATEILVQLCTDFSA